MQKETGIVLFMCFSIGVIVAADTTDCQGIKCENGGTLSMDNIQQCTCACTDGFTGITCKTRLELSQWPDGHYTIPMSKYGCPESEANGWRSGALSIVTMETVDIQKSYDSSQQSISLNQNNEIQTFNNGNETQNTNLLGPFWKNGFVLHFCTKTKHVSISNKPDWPDVINMVYRSEDLCPVGFQTGKGFSLTIPGVMAMNTDGILPDMNIDRKENGTVYFTMFTCERLNSSRGSNSDAFYDQFVVPKGDGECQSTQDLVVELEKITIDFNTTGTDVNVTQNLEFRDNAITLEYCFYKTVSPQKDKVKQLTGEIPELDTMYQIPFSHRRNVTETFMRSKFLYGVRILKTCPVLKGNYYIVTDMYGLHSYRSNTDRDNKPLFNVLEVSTPADYPWILLQLPSQHSIDSVFVALTVFPGENPENLINPSEFMNPGISMSQSEAAFWNHGALLVDFTSYLFYKRHFSTLDYYVTPYVYELPTPHFMVQHRFKRAMMGQYIMIHFPQHELREVEQRKLLSRYFNRMVGFHILPPEKGFPERCSRVRVLRDYQLSASSNMIGHTANSSGLYDSGWCADPGDPSPYLQVDFIFPTLISGIKMKNWRDKDSSVSVGVRSFNLMYGVHEDGFTTYGNKPFEVDTTHPFNTTQTFLFERRFFARYVRLYPVPLAYTACLKFELLECLANNNSILSLECSNVSVVVNTSTAYVSMDQPDVSDNVTSWADCLDKCNTMEAQCSVLEYQEGSQLCMVYGYKGTSNLRTIVEDSSVNTSLATRLCLDESFTMINKGQRHYMHKHGEGVLTSPGYPMSYRGGDVILWLISVDESMVVQIIFTNISLSVFEDTAVCQDRISISPSQFTKFHMENKNLIKQTITARSNGEAVVYWGESSAAYVTFQTCESSVRSLHIGKGFRALIQQTDSPYCYGGWDMKHDRVMACTQPEMSFGSPTYFDSSQLLLSDQEPQIYYVNIFGAVKGNVRYIELRITDLNIPCKKDYLQFIIDDLGDSIQKQYCTFNRPPMLYKSTLWDLSIKLFYWNYMLTSEYKDKKWHGFYGHYKFVYNNETVYNWTTSVTEAPTSWDPYGVIHRTVCSDNFHSCYTMFPSETSFHKTDMSWTRAQEFCVSQGQNLVSLNTKEEYLYVRLMAENYTRTVERYDYRHSFLRLNPHWTDLHIGLVRFPDGQSMVDMWLDGNPLIFSAWAINQPSNVIDNPCTKMRLRFFSHDDNWYSQPCDDAEGSVAGYFICEKKMENTSSSKQPLYHLGSSFPSSSNVKYKTSLFHCESGEYLSWLSVCNGLPECDDMSDELNCNYGDRCMEEDFRCSNSRCITYNKVCDNYRDCLEGEDEHCVSDVDLFECGNHQKVAQDVVCDGEFDCIDGTDESGCASCHSRVLHCKGLTKNCVPHALTCDKYMECRDGADESDCNQFPIESCDDWWGIGMRDNTIVEIDGEKVQCVFNRLDDFYTETVIPLDLVLNYTQETYDYHGDSIQTHYIPMFIRNLLMKDDYHCYIVVLETYQPVVKLVRTADGLGGVSDQVFSTYNFSSYTDLAWLVDVKLNQVMGFETTLEPYKRLQYLNVTCRNRHYNSIYRLPCNGRLQAIDPRRMCLYNDDYLDLGCRTLSHLWNCEDHVCPKHYVKCPRSFCLAISLVCDGRRHCPNGEDEENCYCEGRTDNVHIISYQQTEEEILYHFAQQFLTMTNIVSLTLVSDPEYSIHPDFGYFLHKIKLTREDVTKIDYQLLPKLGATREEAVRSADKVLDFILREEQEKSWLNSTIAMDISSGHILDEPPLPFHIIVIDDVIDDATLWDAIYSSNEDTFSGVKPFRVMVDKNIHGISVTEERSDWTEVKLYDSKYLEYGGFLLFDKICQGNTSGACRNGYRCQASRKCLPLSHLCDGRRHCPHGDDERICGVTCPSECECQGYFVNCRDRNFTHADLTQIPIHARNLDLSLNPYLSNGAFQMQRETNFLTKLNLSSCAIKQFDKFSFRTFSNLQILDLRNNLFTSIPKHTFLSLGSLLEIYLSGNRHLKYLEDQAFLGLTKIRILSVSDTDIKEINTKPFMGLSLYLLDLSGNFKLSVVQDNAFGGLTSKSINIENCPIKSFTADMFTGISGIEEMRTSAYKFCCIRPPTVEEDKCTPSQDKFSSCEDLMQNLSQRALLWIIGLVALIGNMMVVLYRVVYDRSHLKIGHGIFVTNLAVADFFMGLYLIIIAVADQIFRDRYIWMDDYWRNSGWCTFAGVLSTMSSESSIMFMCLITLDRILVIKFPFGQVRFQALSALISVGICWITVVILSVVPIIFSNYFQNEFYSKSGVCIALPLTQERYQGWLYSVIVFVGFNFTTFVLISFGQLLIYQEVQNSSKKFKHGKSARTNDLKVARNLLLVVSTDFLCWGPVGCMGLMSIAGSSIPPTVYAWTAVLILPVNSALNPFLYTLSAVLNKNAFKPRLDEQTRLDPGELLLLKRMLHLWKFQFGQRKNDNDKVEESEGLTKLDIIEIGKVTLQMAHCLRLLHRIHLRMHDICFLSHDGETESDGNIKFIVDPSLCANNKEKADDIHKLGSLIQFMLEHH